MRVHVGDRVIEMTPDLPRPLAGSLRADGLFIYGGEGDSAWFHSIGPPETTGQFAGCYEMGDTVSFDDGDHIVVSTGDDEGLRLPKDEDFGEHQTFGPHDQYPEWLDSFCLNAAGEIADVSP